MTSRLSYFFVFCSSLLALSSAEGSLKSIRRYPLYAAPYYTSPLAAFAPPIPPAPLLAPAPGVAYAPPPPLPAYAAPLPAFQAPPPPPPAYVPVPEISVAVACSPGCLGSAMCIGGACACPTGIAYSPVVGCAPPPPLPPAPIAVVPGRLIPQALPGAPCEPGVECTGGSVCSLGICLCPPELVQEGTVCVARTVYGLVAPPPPPPAILPAPLPLYAPPPAPVAMPPAFAYAPAPVPVALGAPCVAASPCVAGAVCQGGVCACSPAYVPTLDVCVRRRHAK